MGFWHVLLFWVWVEIVVMAMKECCTHPRFPELQPYHHHSLLFFGWGGGILLFCRWYSQYILGVLVLYFLTQLWGTFGRKGTWDLLDKNQERPSKILLFGYPNDVLAKATSEIVNSLIKFCMFLLVNENSLYISSEGTHIYIYIYIFGGTIKFSP